MTYQSQLIARPQLASPKQSLVAQANVQRNGPLDSDYVITRYRGNANLRTQLQKIIKRAGVTPWPKLWQNLRASRATELAGVFPGHVASAFLGHSERVAQKHYWQVTDEDFKKRT